MNFVNLYVQTEYSMLEGPAKINLLVERAKMYGYDALAITDANTVSGIIKFFLACKEQNIKPIIGVKISLKSSMYSSMLLYAKNEVGYKNILKIASESKISKTGVDLRFLKEAKQGVIAVIPSDENEIFQWIKEENPAQAIQLINEYKRTFEEVYFGLDLQSEYLKIHIDEWIAFANTHEVLPVALHRTVYIESDDYEVHRILRCIGNGITELTLSEKEMSMNLQTKEQYWKGFSEYPDLVKRAASIAEKCNVDITFGTYHLPSFIGSPTNDHNAYLIELCKFGLNKRLRGKNVSVDVYKNRLFEELSIIQSMGFSDYFLIVYDFIKYAKKNQILVGPGRGSAPGSLVAYVLGITDVDPIEQQLLFERFLNPERISMPDIDTDFPDNRRDEVIRYVGEKYGKNKIAHISTFGTFGVRLAIRDVARVLIIPEVVLNEVLKYIPSTGNMKSLLETVPGLVRLTEENQQIARLVQLVMKLEGLPRHMSTHAAGIVMTKEDLVEYTALQEGINNLYQTQFEANDLELLGLVKMDFLGLRNLTIIDRVVQTIQELEDSNFSIMDIPYDDKKTYEMIARGETDGVFQLESSGMRNVLSMLKTSTFDDIVNANALFRPGPMEMIPAFVRRKFQQEPIDYPHEDLRSILEPTYGIIVFQEQIMLIAQRFGGYSLGEADILRRAVSKKKAEVLEAERARFVSKSKAQKYTEETAQKVYDYIVKFANYGFNKSHSVAYAMIAYQMAYLKRNYYKYFMIELMNNSIGSIGLIRGYISDCQKKGLQVLIPSIQKSRDFFVLEGHTIYYSLLGIQNVGGVTLSNLLEERDEHGYYKDYIEFVGRTKSILSRRIIESLIHAGALDDFGLSRKQMVLEYENCIELYAYSDLLVDRLQEKQFSKEDYSFEEASQFERDMLGFNLKYSIFKRYEELKSRKGIADLADLPTGSQAVALFALKRIRKIKTKKDDDMAFLEIYDDSDSIDAVVFPTVFSTIESILLVGNVYVGYGKVDERNGKKQLVIERLAIAKK